MDSDRPRKRRKGEGTLFYYARRDLWVGAYFDLSGKRRFIYGHDWRVVERKLDWSFTLSRRSVAARREYRLVYLTRKARAESWATFLLEEAEREEWTVAHTAKVLVAQLSIRRVRAGIFGPCDYSGTWVAGTVDHVVPTSMGGSDERSNLVSACFSCNSRKGHRTPEQYAAAA